MAKNNNLTDLLTSVADAIRSKKGTSDRINPQDFDSEISSIQGETLGGEYNIEQVIDGDSCELNITTAPQPDDLFSSLVSGIITEVTANDLKNVTRIRPNAFSGCGSLASVTFSDNLVKIGENAFSYTALENVVIPDTITYIGKYAFSNCTNLKSVTLPNSLTTLNGYTFYNSGLTSIIIPDSVTILNNSEFAKNSNLTSVTIGDGLTYIGGYMFEACKSLISITLPSNISDIKIRAFADCTSLNNITVLATTPPKLDSAALPSTISTIYIPAGTLSAYQVATNWSSFASKFVELGE